MKKWAVIITAIVGLLGGLAGIWGAYTAQKTLDLRHPIDQHEAMAKSFGGEISSANARRDLQTVTRLRHSYEEYEEHWRTLQVVAAIVKPLEDLRVTKLSPAAAADLSKLVAQLTVADSSPRAPTTMGAAYLALNEYSSAASELSNVTGAKPLMLKAAAFGGLADGTSDLTLREGYRRTARDSLAGSLIASYNSDDAGVVVRFAQDTPALSGLLKEVSDTKAQMRKPHKLDYDKKQ